MPPYTCFHVLLLYLPIIIQTKTNAWWQKKQQFLLQRIYMHGQFLRHTHSQVDWSVHIRLLPPTAGLPKVGPINSTWAEREHAGCSIMKYCPPAARCRSRHRSARRELKLHHKSHICITNLTMSPGQAGDFKSVRKIVHEYLSTVCYLVFY